VRVPLDIDSLEICAGDSKPFYRDVGRVFDLRNREVSPLNISTS